MSKNYDVIILTGWSNPGGSTESYINLTNALNDIGISTIMLGSHKYHLDKCNGGGVHELSTITSKNIIWHFMGIDPSTPMQCLKNTNSVLSCHEMGLNPIFFRYKEQIDYGVFDYFHFVSDHQKAFHLKSYGTPDGDNMVIIPNILDPTLTPSDAKPSKKIGGVIGSIDSNKRTHLSIQAALDDGCDLVKVFGKDTDIAYHMEYVDPMLKDPRVLWHGVVDDKSEMYSTLTNVYHYSYSETWGYVKAECQFLGIPFKSHDNTPLVLNSTTDIVNSWKDILI